VPHAIREIRVRVVFGTALRASSKRTPKCRDDSARTKANRSRFLRRLRVRYDNAKEKDKGAEERPFAPLRMTGDPGLSEEEIDTEIRKCRSRSLPAVGMHRKIIWSARSATRAARAFGRQKTRPARESSSATPSGGQRTRLAGESSLAITKQGRAHALDRTRGGMTRTHLINEASSSRPQGFPPECGGPSYGGQARKARKTAEDKALFGTAKAVP